jgi:hypothetical protein
MPKITQKLIETMSYDATEKKIRDLIDPPDSKGDRSWRYYIKETFPGFAIVRDSAENKFYQVTYTVDAQDNVTIGQWQEGEYVWQPKPASTATPAAPSPDVIVLSESAEEAEVIGLTRLTEAAQATGAGKFRMTVLRPGWNVTLCGAPGDKYYTRQYISSLIPLVEGAKAYYDHQTEREERERPQNSVRKLVGYWSDAKQEADGSAVAVLNLSEAATWLKPILADAEKLKTEKGIVFVGPSINGFGNVRMGEAEGRRGKIVESAKHLLSIDIVTEPGAGGTVDKLLEGAKPNKEDETLDFSKLTLEELKKNRPDLFAQVEQTRETAASAAAITPEQVKELVAKEVDKIKEAAMAPARAAAEELTRERIKQQASPRIREILKESKLPELAQTKLTRMLESREYAKDGALDETALKEAVDAAVGEEREYLSKLTESGKVIGMGGGDPQKPEGREKAAQSKLDKMFDLPEEKPAQ